MVDAGLTALDGYQRHFLPKLGGLNWRKHDETTFDAFTGEWRGTADSRRAGPFALLDARCPLPPEVAALAAPSWRASSGAAHAAELVR
jgi:hypothetical protein